MNDYKFKLSDFIPLIGLSDYVQRNPKVLPDSKWSAISRVGLLAYYNFGVLFGTSYLISKGLESFLN